MTLTTDVQPTTDAAVTDRRRPGRVDISPALIPILRAGEQPPHLNDTLDDDEPDQMAGARGLITGVAISAPMWVAIAYVGRWLLS